MKMLDLEQIIVILADSSVDHVLWFPPPSNDATRSDLKKLPALPTQALKEHPSLAYWWVSYPDHHNIAQALVFPHLDNYAFLSTVPSYSEDRVVEHYKKLNGQSRGQAIVK